MNCKDCEMKKNVKWIMRFMRFCLFTSGAYWGRVIISLLEKITN